MTPASNKRQESRLTGTCKPSGGTGVSSIYRDRTQRPCPRCDNFLYGFKGAPRRAGPFRAWPVPRGDRDVLREFVKRHEVGRQELRVSGGAARRLRGGGLPPAYGR